MTIEHGHANHLCDDWSSTAYWYQLLPTQADMSILPVEQRLPVTPAPIPAPHPRADLTPEQKKAREAFERRWEEYRPRREAQFRIKEEKARRESALNTAFAAKLREDYR